MLGDFQGYVVKGAIFPSWVFLLLEMLALEPRYHALRKRNILIKKATYRSCSCFSS